MQICHGNFNCWDDVQKEFATDESDVGKVVLFAAYDQEDYEGWANVIWFERGQFHLVEESHCSCHGLEDQFSPEATSLDALIRVVGADRFHCGGGTDLVDVLRGIRADLKVA